MTLTAYPVHGKRKSHDLCRAFIAGAGKSKEDAAVFYGVDATNLDVWRRVKRNGTPFYYIDNSYFDATRGTHFRITKNGLQHPGFGEVSNGERFESLGVKIRPRRESGEYVLICPQSFPFMANVIGAPPSWYSDLIAAAGKAYPDVPLSIRTWSSDKPALAATLAEALSRARALVTHSSAAAVEAVLAGVDVLVDKISPAYWVEYNDSARYEWACVLADNQWTTAEMQTGLAWRHLNP